MDFNQLEPTPQSLSANAIKATGTLTPDALLAQWRDAFERATKPSHRLTLLYFVNEVCQRCKKSKPEYLEAFARALPDAFESLGTQQPDMKPKMLRIVQVWRDRDVFNGSDLDQFQAAISGEGRSSKRVKLNDTESDPFSQSAPMARGNSSASLDDGFLDLRRPSSAGNSDSDSFLVDIVTFPKDLSPPESIKALLELMAESERDSVKLDLDQENQDRFALKLFKYLRYLKASKSVPISEASVDEMLESLAAMRNIRKLIDDEEKMKTDAKNNPDLQELVETDERLQIDLKSWLSTASQRRKELDVESERAQNILIGLAELLATHTVPLDIDQAAQDSEGKQITEKIAALDELSSIIRSKLKRIEDARVLERQRAALPPLPPPFLTAQVGGTAPVMTQPPAGGSSQRQRKQRWGEPAVTNPVPNPVQIPISGSLPPLPSPWVQGYSGGAPPPPFPTPYVPMKPQQQPRDDWGGGYQSNQPR